MLLLPAATLPRVWNRVAQLRADAHQVTSQGHMNGPGCLNRDMQPLLSQPTRQLANLWRNHRLAAGYYHMPGPELAHLLENLLNCQILAFRSPGGVRGIAPDAPEIAPGRPDKRRRHPDQ